MNIKKKESKDVETFRILQNTYARASAPVPAPSP